MNFFENFASFATKPFTYILIGSVIVVIAGFWAAYEQHIHDEDVAKFLNASVEKTKKQNKHNLLVTERLDASLENIEEAIKNIKGDDTLIDVNLHIPSASLSISNMNSKYPLYDMTVIVNEYWYPLPKEKLPENFWDVIKANRMYWLTKRIGEYKPDGTLLQGDVFRIPHKFEPETFLFPNTGRLNLSISIQARNGMTRHLITAINRDGKGWDYFTREVRIEEGSKEKFFHYANVRGEWGEAPPLISPDGTKHHGPKILFRGE